MILENFKQVHNNQDYLVTVLDRYVWDYKLIGNTLYLISEDPWEGVEEEYVSVGELEDYLIESGLPGFQGIEVIAESSGELLKNYHFIPETETVNFEL